MPGHDDTNIVLIEILSEGFEIEYSTAGLRVEAFENCATQHSVEG